ncbi:helix-turn-helix domain-containing protein [Phormidium pseudopriestleyi FRX01]|uniref:Helix-turn-helix domain-containing protein n=1 Tax=Phormidium pseudopriestleyi FRX01 TaxID=1759528 RepID=A0ABS3FZ26_9CYAN|nr:excisionase family DNA-binding protein [Phormidium pseudopriestleyi]MBO0351998.1 helix-turn-helix domain-containing protein [Phormidium pseudopriestleyi FRX01]
MNRLNFTSAYPLPPTEEEAKLAKESSQNLAFFTKVEKPEIIIKTDEMNTQAIAIPESAFLLLVEILEQMAQGRAVSLVSFPAELTTQEAANILEVSHPYLVELLESGEIPSQKVEATRQVRYEDVLNYKNQIDEKRQQTLDELVTEAQTLNMGYD